MYGKSLKFLQTTLLQYQTMGDDLVSTPTEVAVVREEVSRLLNIVLGSGLEIVGVLGLCSIGVLLITIVRFKYLKTEPSFIIIFALALADFGHLAVVAGHVGPELLMHEVSWGNFLETIVTHGNLMCWYFSIGNFNLMAINRFYAVCRPMSAGRVFSVRRTACYCIIASILALSLALTPLTGFCCRKIFDIHWDEEEFELKNEWDNHLKVLTICLNWITVVVMCACYTAVFMKLRNSNKVSPEARTSRQQKRQLEKQKLTRNICYQFLAISLVFSLLLCFQVATQLGLKHKAVISILQFLYAANSGVNPIIYLAFNKKLRGQMVATLLCRRGVNTLGQTHFSKTAFSERRRPTIQPGPSSMRHQEVTMHDDVDAREKGERKKESNVQDNVAPHRVLLGEETGTSKRETLPTIVSD